MSQQIIEENLGRLEWEEALHEVHVELGRCLATLVHYQMRHPKACVWTYITYAEVPAELREIAHQAYADHLDKKEEEIDGA